MDCTRPSRKFLNWSGASSGWTFAGTQSSLETSPSSSSPCGAIDGMAISDMLWKGIRSGSELLPTSMDIRRRFCRLLSSWAMSLGSSMFVRGNCDEPACTSRNDRVGDAGDIGDFSPLDASSELLRWLDILGGSVLVFLRPIFPLVGMFTVRDDWSDVERRSGKRAS